MKRSNRLKHITVCVALFFVFQNEVRSQARVEGTVAGSVLDQQGAVILLPKPVIVFRSKNEVKQVTVDENGRFEATLPIGTYEITTEMPGFYPFRRAPFRVSAGSSVMINLVPSRRYFTRGTTVSPGKGVDERAPRPGYKVISKSSLPGLIQFESSHNVGRWLRYRFAVFSHDHITVYADELLFDPKALRLKASGGVILEDGKQRIEVNGVTVSFDNGEARLEVTKE